MESEKQISKHFYLQIRAFLEYHLISYRALRITSVISMNYFIDWLPLS